MSFRLDTFSQLNTRLVDKKQFLQTANFLSTKMHMNSEDPISIPWGQSNIFSNSHKSHIYLYHLESIYQIMAGMQSTNRVD
jgi:hypothetical protein